MTIAIRSVVVNTAFLQEIKQDNQELPVLLDRLRSVCDTTQLPWLRTPELAGVLEDVRDQLAFHFSLEEAYGYFEDAILEAPNLSDEADRLRKEHCLLYEEIREIAERAQRLISAQRPRHALRALIHRIRAFLDQLDEHEAREMDLIQSAYGVDIGVGD